MEGDEGEPGWPQYPADLVKGSGKLAGLEMDDRVEHNSGAELAVSGRQIQKVALAKLDRGMLPPAHGDHGSGQVNADRGDAVAGEPGRDVPGAAADVRDRYARLSLLDEAGQQGAIERLVGEFAAEFGGIFVGDRVVAAANRLAATGLVHAAVPSGQVNAVVRGGREEATRNSSG